ncbi:MAG: hypothetical protein LQ340_000952 [Diploschistes diacapsis]|nr:MAG: hypothetical protein LQ340_000952 [Diploschistes diacapsis]
MGEERKQRCARFNYSINSGSFELGSSEFFDAHIVSKSQTGDSIFEGSTLGFSRAYSLALSPQIIYSKSALLPTLVSSKVYRQLEFLAVGAWWIYEQRSDGGNGSLRKIPSSREDVFADKSIDLKSKRLLMRFLKFITDPEAFSQAIEEFGDSSFENFLSQQYNIPLQLQPIIQALTLSPSPAAQTKTSFALPRILRHLSSIGTFGPGFGAVVPKWGGLAEIAQVGCRACAVGGGVYMLGKGVQGVPSNSDDYYRLMLGNAERVKTKWKTGLREDLQSSTESVPETGLFTRSISIVASDLAILFPPIADGAPPSACTVVVFPPSSLQQGGSMNSTPVYIMVHSSETGECPAGQSILYASIRAVADEGKQWLEMAMATLLSTSAKDGEEIDMLWSLFYSQKAWTNEESSYSEDPASEPPDKTVLLSNPSTDLAFNDSVLREVRRAWQHITGNESGFMEFEDREVGEYDDAS